MSYASSPHVPEDFKVLSMMNNVGAVTPEKSLTLEDLAMWTGLVETTLRDHLKKVMEQGYVAQIQVQDAEKYYITKMGIIKVMTMYS
jgi:DNA-binding IclR family transcriptional regulator